MTAHLFPPALHCSPTPLPAVRRTALACLLTLVAIVGWAVEARTQGLARDKAALVALYNATDGPNWTNNTNWLSSEPVGGWHGVTVSNGRVTRLWLQENQLSGTIPAELSNLANLEWLSLAHNQLNGSIPDALGNLANLELLWLSNNQLTGSIPSQLGNLTNLTTLFLSRNQLSGSIPDELGNLTNLEELYLSNNRLTGPLPRSLTNLESLDILLFRDNGTNGLCAPTDSEFQNWLRTVNNSQGPNCTAGGYTIPEQRSLTYPKAGSGLDDLIARVASDEISAEDAAAEAPLHRGDAIAVTIHLSGNVNGVATFLKNNNVTPGNRGTDYIEAFVPVGLLGTLSQQTGVLRVRMIQPPQPDQMGVAGNGPAVHGSPAWNTAGFTGTGVKVGVIDAGFTGFGALMGTDLPATVQRKCYTGVGAYTESLTDCQTNTHGTAVAESIVDIAPDVQLYIANPRSQADLRNVVDWMVGEAVQVINYSMTWTFDGPGDGTSPSSISPLNTVGYAVSQGIAWVNSAGNSGEQTWFTSSPSFLPYFNAIRFDGSDIGNAVSMGQNWELWFELRWDDTWNGAARDLDLCIGNPTTGVILKCTADPQNGVSGQVPYETLWFKAPSTGTYELLIVHRNGTQPGWIQLTNWDYTLEHRTGGSIGNPGESANPGMLTVGAASWNHVATIDSYSSQGPSPDGRTKPDVVGAACGKTETYSRFCGTSQASPHVAGMAALVRQRFPQATPAQVAAYLKANAEQRISSPDPNNTWGHGFAVLPPVSPHTISCTNGTTIPDPHNNPGLVRDCEALLAARDPLRGSASLNWAGSVPISMWEGISVGGTPQRVTSLVLPHKQLTGSIPAGLGSLANLVSLWLSNNQLTGSIPTELGNLSNLQDLYLGKNQLTGTIPSELGNLASLGYLDLSNNQLTGSLPTQLGNLANLGSAYLGANRLTGALPAELGKLTNLEALYLSHNQVAGTIPTQLGDLPNLAELALSDNQLTGTLPQSFTNLRRLGVFHFNLNPGLCAQDSGPVRTWLNGVGEVQGPDCSPTVLLSANPSRLFEGSGATALIVTAQRTAAGGPTTVDLRLGGSAKAGMGHDYTLTGRLSITIPADTASGTTMLTLTPLDDGLAENDENIIFEAAVGNKTEGSVTLPLIDMARACAARDRVALEALYTAAGGSGWTDRTNWGSEKPLSDWHGVAVDRNGCVTRLNLKNNQLTGSIPAQVGNLNNLQELGLHDNQLTGPIPTELGNLTNLLELLLKSNQLTGNIPAALGNLANLEVLWFHSNQLTGTIPAQLGDLASLRQLSLSNNQLTGNIPAELGRLPNLWNLSLSVNQLKGSIPAQLGNLANLRELYLHDNQLTGNIPTELGRFASLTELWLSDNQLTGNIPRSFTQLAALERFFFHNNSGLCAQADVAIRNWLNNLDAAVGPDCTLSDLVVPVIISASGRSESFFTSELALTNRGSQTATLRHTYTAAAGGGSGEVSETLAPGRQKIVPDAIDYFRTLGVPIPATGNRIGTLRVEVSGSEVGATVRTTTRVADGRAGLAYPGIAVEDGFEGPVYLCGLRQNAQDRSNVAFQNIGASGGGNISLRTTVFSGDPQAPSSHVMPDVILAPGGFHQYSGLLATAGIEQGYVRVERVSGTAPFYAYGVINDQANSDGSFVFPVAASSLAGVRGLTLPVVIEHPNFSSELIVTNFSNSTKHFDFHFVADAIGTPDNTASVYDEEIPPGGQAIIPDAVQVLREYGAEGIGPRGRTIAGAVFFEAIRGDMSGVVIGARTGSPGGGGQYSVFYNAVPYGAAFDREAWIDALQQNRENRSNLALVNTGEADGSDSVFELEIYNGDTGRLVNTVTGIRVAARGWHQINGILGNYAPGTTQGYVRVRKTAGNNPFLAYGVVNDGGAPGQRSGDGAYLPAQP